MVTYKERPRVSLPGPSPHSGTNCMDLQSSCRGQGHLSSSGSLVAAGLSLWPDSQLLLALPGRRYEQAFGLCPPSRTFFTHKTRVSCGLLHCPGGGIFEPPFHPRFHLRALCMSFPICSIAAWVPDYLLIDGEIQTGNTIMPSTSFLLRPPHSLQQAHMSASSTVQ